MREYETSASKGWEADEQFTSAITLLHFDYVNDGGGGGGDDAAAKRRRRLRRRGEKAAAERGEGGAPLRDGGGRRVVLAASEGFWLLPDGETWAAPAAYALAAY